MYYVRLAYDTHSKGLLVPKDEVQKNIDSIIEKKPSFKLKSWYSSPFFYGEEALEHFKSGEGKSKNSIAGYKGSALCDMLYWDLDCKTDFNRAIDNTSRLLDKLEDYGLFPGLDLYFSGNKGFHVTVKIEEPIEQPVLVKVVRGIAKEAGIDKDVFDTSVYNITRYFRLVNTLHQESELYKIPLLPEDLTLSEAEIREMAETTCTLDIPPAEAVDIFNLIQKFNIKEEIVVSDKEAGTDITKEFSDLIHSGKRRQCVVKLEQGEFGPGERNDGILRLAAYYRFEGLSKGEARDKINKALSNRSEKYEVNPINDAETDATLDHVFSGKWTGGCFSCKSDDFLQKVCSNGGDKCEKPKTAALGKGVKTIGNLLKTYIDYGNEASDDWPEFGLSSIDSLIRIRPRNYSIIAGANGCVDSETEFMSSTGWKKISEWDGQEEVLQFDPETGEANLCKPLDYIKKPCDEFFHFETKYGLDQTLSAEHTVLYYDKNNNPKTASMAEVYDRHMSSSFGFRGKFKTSFEINKGKTSLDLSNESIRVMVAVIADGTFSSNTNTCTIKLKKELKKQRLELLLNKAGIDFKATRCNGEVEGYHRYVFQAPWRQKSYEPNWYSASNEQLRIITDEVLRWDGYRNQFSTCVKESADFIQYAFSATGKRASIYTLDRVGEKRGEYTRKSVEYSVIVASSEFTSIAGKTEERGIVPITKVKPKDGFKYCFTMPSGFLVLRRNNKIFTTGNSGKTSLILEMMDNLNSQKIPHLFFSLDMADTSLFEKIAARYTRYSLRQIESAFSVLTRDEGKMREIAESLVENLPYTYFNFKSMATMEGIKTIINKLNEDIESPIQVVFIDYTGRLTGDSDSQYANATANALKANDIAKETNTHLMFIAQISRQHGDHTEPIRNNRVAKESGAWEENATSVMTVWRPFGKGTEGIEDRFMVAYIGKNRNGRLGECYFHWNGQKGKVRELTDEELVDYTNLCKSSGLDLPQAIPKTNRGKVSSRLDAGSAMEDKGEDSRKPSKLKRS